MEKQMENKYNLKIIELHVIQNRHLTVAKRRQSNRALQNISKAKHIILSL
jgi:hypothetical protein